MSKEYLDKEGLSKLWSRIKKYIANKDIRTSTPVGGSIDWYGLEDTIPSDWMREDGRSLKKSEYPELFTIIGYTYGGSGDNFNIPNSKGRVTVHLDESDNDFKTLGNKYGWKEHQLTINQLPHLYGDLISRVWNNTNILNVINSNFMTYVNASQSTVKWIYSISGVADNTINNPIVKFDFGNDETHPNVQPSIVSYKIIKVKEDAASRDLRLLDEQLNNHMNIQHGSATASVATIKTVDSIGDGQWKSSLLNPDTFVITNPNLFEQHEEGIKIKQSGYYKLSGKVEAWINPNGVYNDQLQARICTNYTSNQSKTIIISTGQLIYKTSEVNIMSGVTISPITVYLKANDVVNLVLLGMASNITTRTLLEKRCILTVETV